jgi:predicted DNA-binding transcriptional regulator AlpA
MPEHETYLTAEQTAKRLHLSVERLYHRRSAGLPTPPAAKFGRNLLFPEGGVTAFIEAHMEKAA